MNKFIFDVDGTLTPSREKVNLDFKEWLITFFAVNDVYLVTGSDHQKTVEQLGTQLVNSAQYVFNCSGNDVWSRGKNIETSNWILPEEAREWLVQQLNLSKFPLRTGNHIEVRPGTVNFSVVGRGATLKERMMYRDWDTTNSERAKIALEFNHKYPELEARIGGETGIDIYAKGCDKSQILKYFSKEDKLFFFGDRCDPGGNDYPLAKLIKNSYQVKNWRDTWERLEYLREVGFVQ
jgi:phosphomannomutase